MVTDSRYFSAIVHTLQLGQQPGHLPGDMRAPDVGRTAVAAVAGGGGAVASARSNAVSDTWGTSVGDSSTTCDTQSPTSCSDQIRHCVAIVLQPCAASITCHNRMPRLQHIMQICRQHSISPRKIGSDAAQFQENFIQYGAPPPSPGVPAPVPRPRRQLGSRPAH